MEQFKSRKFILSALFVVVVCVNYWVVAKQAIEWQSLLALAGMIGVYAGANAYESASNNPTVRIEQSDSSVQYAAPVYSEE